MMHSMAIVLAVSIGTMLAGVRLPGADGPAPPAAVETPHDHGPGAADSLQAGQHRMGMHQRVESVAADAELNRLVETMNAATGAEKATAMAAVLTRLVQEQEAMRAHMHDATQSMMRHCDMMSKSADGHEHHQ